MQIIRHYVLRHEGQIKARLFITDHTKTGTQGNIELAVPLKKLELLYTEWPRSRLTG
jgi:hypothetical protein